VLIFFYFFFLFLFIFFSDVATRKTPNTQQNMTRNKREPDHLLLQKPEAFFFTF